MRRLIRLLLPVFILILNTGCVQKSFFAGTAAKRRQEDFCSYLASHIKYPVMEREWQVSGQATAVFVTNSNGDLQYLNIVQFPTNNLGQEVFNKIKTAITLKKLGKGNWILPIRFSMFIINPDKTQTPIPESKQQADALVIRDGGKNNYIYNPNEIITPKNTTLLSEIQIHGYMMRPREVSVD